jgi:hypothetical protein
MCTQPNHTKVSYVYRLWIRFLVVQLIVILTVTLTSRPGATGRRRRRQRQRSHRAYGIAQRRVMRCQTFLHIKTTVAVT